MITDSFEKSLIEEFKTSHPGAELSFGASSIMITDDNLLFSLVKPKHWRTESKTNTVIIDFSGIGGSIEPGETPYQCLIREINEEICLNLKDYQVLKPQKTYLVGEETVRVIECTPNQDVPTPLMVLELKIPQEKLRPGQPTESYLILFIYLVCLTGILPSIRESEEIPGLVVVSGRFLADFLNGLTIPKNRLIAKNYQIYIREKYHPFISKNICFSPKFTPIALMKSGLNYRDLKDMVDEKNED